MAEDTKAALDMTKKLLDELMQDLSNLDWIDDKTRYLQLSSELSIHPTD